jgi:hypothetical protein
MKRKITAFLLLAFYVLISQGAEAQREAGKTFKNSLAIQPLYWLNSGLRIDYERQLKNSHHWLQFSAIGYYVDDEDLLWNSLMNSNRPIQDAWGSGLEVNYKWLPFQRPQMYLSGGLSFSHFNVGYRESGYHYLTYRENELTYYELDWGERRIQQDFDRIGTNFRIGFQTHASRRFLIDSYVGIGHMYSFYDGGKPYPGTDLINSLSYRGVTLTAGFRIGFRL